MYKAFPHSRYSFNSQNTFDDGEMADMSEGMQATLRALENISQRMNMQFDTHINVLKDSSEFSVRAAVDSPSLTIGSELLKSGAAKTDAEMENVLLHELGHNHYHAVCSSFHELRDAAYAMAKTANIYRKINQEPARMAAYAIKAYGSIDAFVSELHKAAKAFIARSVSQMDSHYLQASDAQVAQWLLMAHKEWVTDIKHASPLDSVKKLSVKSEWIQLKKVIADFEHQTIFPDDVRDAEPEGKRLNEAMMAIMPDIYEGCRILGKALRAEEYLCDDFMLMFSNDPKQCVSTFSKSLGPSFHAYGITHPTNEDRLERATALSKRLLTAKEVAGSLLETLPGYLQWVTNRAVTSIQTALTSTPRRLS